MQSVLTSAVTFLFDLFDFFGGCLLISSFWMIDNLIWAVPVYAIFDDLSIISRAWGHQKGETAHCIHFLSKFLSD